MSDTVKRAHNFNAGPSVLPLAVLEQAQGELLDFKGTGMSVMEISHRSKEFEAVIGEAEHDLRELLGIPANYKVLFLQGGATLQFAMIPMNCARPARRPITSSPAPGARRPSRKPRNWARARWRTAARAATSTRLRQAD